jgi:hypothetical protein
MACRPTLAQRSAQSLLAAGALVALVGAHVGARTNCRPGSWRRR